MDTNQIKRLVKFYSGEQYSVREMCLAISMDGLKVTESQIEHILNTMKKETNGREHRRNELDAHATSVNESSLVVIPPTAPLYPDPEIDQMTVQQVKVPSVEELQEIVIKRRIEAEAVKVKNRKGAFTVEDWKQACRDIEHSERVVTDPLTNILYLMEVGFPYADIEKLCNSLLIDLNKFMDILKTQEHPILIRWLQKLDIIKHYRLTNSSTPTTASNNNNNSLVLNLDCFGGNLKQLTGKPVAFRKVNGGYKLVCTGKLNSSVEDRLILRKENYEFVKKRNNGRLPDEIFGVVESVVVLQEGGRVYGWEPDQKYASVQAKL